MRVETFSHPKDRTGKTANDDVILLMPGVYGVFDGATDPRGIIGRSGKSSGLFAAEILARHCAQLFGDVTNFEIPMEALLDQLASKLANSLSDEGYQSLPTSTLALALVGSEKVRVLIAGDSGVRVNGRDVYRHLKGIDDVSAAARVEVFKLLVSRGSDEDETELVARRAIFQGFDTCVAEGVLTEEDAVKILDVVAQSQSEIAPFDVIDTFVRAGIKSQGGYGNKDTHPLGFSVLNGVSPSMKDVIDVEFEVGSISTLEVFSDGYFDLPSNVGIEAWEQKFDEVENVDARKIDTYPNVKGSTATEFSDDRSIIVVTQIA
jgi:hypothetical protein